MDMKSPVILFTFVPVHKIIWPEKDNETCKWCIGARKGRFVLGTINAREEDERKNSNEGNRIKKSRPPLSSMRK
jgi:hypothetical protein